MLNHGITFISAKVCSPAIFGIYFSYHNDIWIAGTDYYISRGKSGIYWIQVRCATAVEISLCT